MTNEQVKYVITLQDNFSKRLNVIESKTNRFDKGISGIGSRLSGLFAGVGVAMIGSKIIKSIAAHEQALAELGSITGMTGKDLDILNKKAAELSQQFGTTGTDILKSMAIIGSKKPELLANADALAEVTKQVDIMAKASGMDGVQSADALTKAMNIFGYASSKAAYVNDVFATSAQKGTAPIGALADAMVNVGPAARAMGFSFEDTNVLLQMMAKGGLEGVDAGTKLKMVLSKLAATGKREFNPTYTSLKDIIKNITKATDTTTKAMNLFGAESWSVGKILSDQSAVLDSLSGKLYEQGSALEMAKTNTDTLKGSWQQLTGAFDGFVNSVVNGDSILSDFLKNRLKTFSNNIKYFTKSLQTDEKKVEDYGTSNYTTIMARVDSMTERNEKIAELWKSITEYKGYAKGAIKLMDDAYKRGKKYGVKPDTEYLIKLQNEAEANTKTVKLLTKAKNKLLLSSKITKKSNEKTPKEKTLTNYTKVVAANPKVFNIDIKNLIETFNLNTSTMGASVDGIKKQIIETFMEAINDTQILANS